jgi:F0F1-type ATP synthase membrane subunit b/b'
VNLLVVIGLLVTVVAENLNERLRQRQLKVQIMFTALDEEEAQSKNKLDRAQKRLEVAHSHSKDIHRLSREKINSEFTRIQTQLNDEFELIREKKKQSIRYERRQKIQDIYTTIMTQAYTRIVDALTRIFSMKSPTKSLIFEQENINIILVEKISI